MLSTFLVVFMKLAFSELEKDYSIQEDLKPQHHTVSLSPPINNLLLRCFIFSVLIETGLTIGYIDSEKKRPTK